MNRREDFLASKIDRSREAPKSKLARDARRSFLRATARENIAAMIADLESQDRAAILCDTLDMVAESLRLCVSPSDAMTAFSSRAADIGASLKLPRAIASARAEQLFAPKAANDREDA
jgi:hypothetical protein